jgi:hypothetical protein
VKLIGSHNAWEYERIFARDFPHAAELLPTPAHIEDYDIGSDSGEEGNCSCFQDVEYFYDSEDEMELRMSTIIKCKNCY